MKNSNAMTDKMREEVARAIWNIRREEEDRCDMELEDMGAGHSVWVEADAAIGAMRETLVIELPAKSACCDMSDTQSNMVIEDCRAAIEAAGLKVKP